MAAPLSLPVGDKDVLTLAVVDTTGNPIAVVTPTPTWASSDPSVATVTPAADGMSATVVQVGAAGSACIITTTVTPTVTAQESVQIIAGKPSGIPASATITAGDPVPA